MLVNFPSRTNLLRAFLARDLIDHRTIVRLGDWVPLLLCNGQPGLLGLLNLSQRCLRRLTKGRAEMQVGNVGDISTILFAVEGVDVVIPQRSSSKRRL